MRKLFVALGTAALVAGGTWAAVAVTTTGRTAADCIDTVWRTSSVSTSSTTWEAVPGLEATPTAIFPVTIDVSAVVSGAPVEFRILSTNVGGQMRVSKPGPAPFDPGPSGPSSFAYLWVAPNQAAAPHAITLELQWRSATGDPVTLDRGVMAVTYTTDGCEGS
jgi:hypothetical protein